MNPLKIAAAVVNQTPLDWKRNVQHHLDAIAEAKKQNISLLCFPELSISGYGCEDMFYAPGVTQTAGEMLQLIADASEGIMVSVGLPVRYNHRLYNTACFIADKKIQGFVCKKNLPGNSIYYEPRWFHAWEAGVVTSIEINGQEYPAGDLIFEVQGIRVGYEICEDAWIAHRPGRELYLRGVDIILNPSASHFEFGKSFLRERFVMDASRAFGATYLYVNLLGNESGRAIFDGDAFITSSAVGLASGSRFSYKDFLLVSAVIDVDNTRLSQIQNRVPLIKNDFGIVKVPFVWYKAAYEPYSYELESWEKSQYTKEEEFARCIALALFDYLRKSRSNGWVISLSGGADSSAIASLCRLAIKLCIEEIGLEGLKKKLFYQKDIQNCLTEADVAATLITCVYQATENSSDDTRNSAETLAKDLDVEYFEISIDTLVKEYRSLIEGGLGRKLSWETDDVPLQNIQARVRAPSIWLLANVKNALLLSTSNRSEAAVGYATMDGDTAGSISPIAGINKHFIRQWLRWLETDGLEGRIRFAGLKAVNSLQPTAELRPQDKKQTDEEDLMPYALLDAIEDAAIRDKKMPKDILPLMKYKFEGIYAEEIIIKSIERFFRLWSRNQWKRERYAPGFHVDDHSLDPKTWCRFPILSGGFEKELEDMRKSIGA
ncbi:NAD(+) synthase [Xanthocytophaga agilis]|uniref:Glutamine-dependent NAD(+) synthetase n=1 Tax=Xanthocytophaga agilis TaxID=3048010 RepID=A0AAE3R722_9BACT|nr:NAD(+) synthase [Xanthocytophaga agilis]MDJ1504395.1 NAD(+) synthase [Xanthocytophaga agilis]